MSKNKDMDELKLVLDDYQEIEDYTVGDVYDYVEEENKRRHSKKEQARIKRNKKMKKRKRIKIILLVLEIFIVLVLGLVAAVLVGPESFRNKLISCTGKCAGNVTGIDKTFDNKYNDKTFDDNKVDYNEELDITQYEEYITVALFGIDSRDNSLDVGLSDSIIIATVNTKSKEVRMSSIARDSWLSLLDSDGDVYYGKVNSAFNYGGVELALTNLNRNLDIKIDEYAVVNFAGLATIIDAFGGLDVNITEDERYYINGYLVETREVTGLDTPDVYSSGNVHLTGLQATAYCRIRQVTFTDEDGAQYNDDFGRTARQRSIIKKMISKAKQIGVDNVVDIANELFGANDPAFKTSMTYDEVMDLLPTVLGFSLAGTESFPYTCIEGDKDYIPNRESVVAIQGLTYNVTKLHKFLYPNENYKATTTLKNISNDLAFRFNIDEVKLPEDQ